MITVLSPAKTLDFETPMECDDFTLPRFASRSRQLIEILKRKSLDDLRALMDISEALALENAARYKRWKASRKPGPTSRQAAFAFKGDVYLGLDYSSLDSRDRQYAQSRLLILSGLYGILRPHDVIAPHRLEMGTSLANDDGPSLYAYWKDTQTKFLNREARKSQTRRLLNLASAEYFKAINSKSLKMDVVAPRFLDSNDGETYRVMSFYAKRSRGSMARWVIKNRVDDVETLKSYREDGYRYDASRSTDAAPTFIRSHAN